MRVIAGQFKGKKILEPKDKTTRPLKNLVKESIFNIIVHSKKISVKINKSNILDLFSGVGSFGLEALSRGSSQVTFVENYPNVIKVLRDNINNLDVNQNCRVIEKNINKELNFKEINCKFDIIFLDPPYKFLNVNMLMNKIYESKILKKNNLIILHRHRKDNSISYERFNLLEEKTYGISKIIFGNYLK